MRFCRRLALLALAPLGFSACLSEPTRPIGTPIDCATLATSIATATGLTTTSSGLRFRDQTVGAGTTVAAGQVLSIHYAGCLTSGLLFDQNLDVDPPFVFTVGTNPLQVIAGFDEGVRGMRVGGRRQLVIPPALGYGQNAAGSIPANSTLVFTIDAVSVR